MAICSLTDNFRPDKSMLPFAPFGPVTLVGDNDNDMDVVVVVVVDDDTDEAGDDNIDGRGIVGIDENNMLGSYVICFRLSPPRANKLKPRFDKDVDVDVDDDDHQNGDVEEFFFPPDHRCFCFCCCCC